MRKLKRVAIIMFAVMVMCSTTAFAVESQATPEQGQSNTEIAIDKAGEAAEKALDGIYNYDAGRDTAKTDKAVEDTLPDEEAIDGFFEQVDVKGRELSDNFFGAFFSKQLGVEKVPLSKFVVSLVKFLVVVGLQALSVGWRIIKAVLESISAK